MTTFKKIWRLPFPIAAVLAVAALSSGCSGGSDQTEAAKPSPVRTIITQTQSFVLSSELPGRIEPVRVAEVRARVAGIVLSRDFQEGADVKAGQVLFQIDPAPFKAALSRELGELAQAEAALSDAQAVFRRYKPLAKVGAVSQQDFDTAQVTVKSAEAVRQSAQADVETARLNLDYATVRAPIAGRIGRAQVTEGALVGQNEATAMATIQQLDPIYVDFKQPVAGVLRMRAALSKGRLIQDREQASRISISVEGIDKARDGQLLFSDISVDSGTGQVSLRGQFANPDGLLLPGMYVRVHTGQGVDPHAILVPQRAVLRGTDGKAQVLVVGEDDVAQTRPVRTGTMRGSDWHILEGLKPGEQVIVGGVVKPGDKVAVATPVESPATSPSTERE
ncbi:efflux RND transporter periplasmic adaptor subunit [Advenella kashmirensis]